MTRLYIFEAVSVAIALLAFASDRLDLSRITFGSHVSWEPEDES